MPLQAGTRLGPYEIQSQIGAGGMGEVYRARDTRLDRIVAVKVLAPDLAGNGEFRTRFAHEAKAISALNHPHICGLFDIGREQDTEYLVLEFLEGETLEARIKRGPLPLPQVLRYGIEIADALEAAHRKGVVHRDLKPGNVMLTAGGVKLLDFGLAKYTTRAAGQALSMLATAPGTGTAQGTIIGTLQYMAPEQVQGAPADARTDIFALGMLLYEMATGRRAFEASTQASLIAKILESEPPAVSTLVPLASPALDHVIQNCLAKEPSDRWQAAHDVKLELQWVQTGRSRIEGTPVVPSLLRLKWGLWAVSVAAVALAATVLISGLRRRPALPAPLPMRYDLILPSEMQLDEYDRGAMAPDGQQFVFSAAVQGVHQLVRRDMATAALQVIADTKDAWRPFWSPDSRSIGFLVAPAGELRRVLVTGGSARVLGDLSGMVYEDHGTWSRGTILFGPRHGRILRVAEMGGRPTALDIVPRTAGQKDLSFPEFLPDGQHFLVSVANEPAVYVGSVEGPGLRKLLDDASAAIYAAGHLIYSRGAGLFARPFDAERQEVSGAEVQVATQAESFSVSEGGVIAYRPENVPRSRLTWFDRSGRRTATLGDAGPYEQVVLSPHARHATVVRLDAHRRGDLWDWDLRSGIFTRLTTDPEHDTDPSWSPDERTLAFTSERGGSDAMFLKDSVSGKEEPLVLFGEPVTVDQWTPDGRYVIFRTFGKAVYSVPLGRDRTPRMLVDTPYVEDEVHVSPDGRWVAFNADESGQWEVYVAAFPGFTSKRQISRGGGVQPQWRGDGEELFYLAPDGSIMSVSVNRGSEFMPKPPVRLFTSNIAANSGTPQYGVTADGQRFLALERVSGTPSFTFLLNHLSASSNTGGSH